MFTIALSNRGIFVCRELYLNENIATNLALFLLVSLSRSDRLCNEIKLVQTSRLYDPSEIYIGIDEGGRFI